MITFFHSIELMGRYPAGRRIISTCSFLGSIIIICCALIFLSSLCRLQISHSHSRRGVRLGATSSTTAASYAQSQVAMSRRRELLGEGPGSRPPRCTGKCGNCTPCNPVHVAVPPGTPVTTEYYPEAWRCKCGNKLYLP